MKISCVRCGKKIDSPNVYCRECQKDMGITIGSPPRSKRRWYTYLLVLLLLVFVGIYFFIGNDEIVSKVSSLAGEVEHTAEKLKKTVFDQLHIEESGTQQNLAQESAAITQDAAGSMPSAQPAADSGKADSLNLSPAPGVSETPPASGEAVAETAETTSPASEDVVSEQAQPSSTGQSEASETAAKQDENVVAEETEATKPQAGGEESGETPADPQNGTKDISAGVVAGATEQSATEEDNPLLHVGILVYYLRKEGSDVRVQKQLLDAGYTDVVVKGKWSGSFNDQNVFYRSENQPGVKEIMAVLGPHWFGYYYNGERISRSVKKIFNEDDHIQFLIIPK